MWEGNAEASTGMSVVLMESLGILLRGHPIAPSIFKSKCHTETVTSSRQVSGGESLINSEGLGQFHLDREKSV